MVDIFLGRSYFYNKTTRQSTYVHPTHSPTLGQHHPTILPDVVGHGQYPLHVSTTIAGHSAFQLAPPLSNQNAFDRRLHGTREHMRSHERSFHSQPKDRPKRSQPIPNCSPWLLVRTKLGRRFVHNPDIQESFWKFPPEVLRAVTEFDRKERERRLGQDEGEARDSESATKPTDEGGDTTPGEVVKDGDKSPAIGNGETGPRLVDSDGEEYEEVEVTDDEVEDHESKRLKIDGESFDQPVEFNEDDIAYQLAAMGEDYGLDPGEYGGDEVGELEEGAEGLALTEEDSKALFKDMLNDFQISPYTTWEKVVEAGHIVEDDRYIVLPTMRARRNVWDEWSRETIQQRKERREQEQKLDPKIPYFLFLQKYATPKLYWPEFRRKYKKEPEMHNSKLQDKDREKWYRDYIIRLRLSESKLKSDLIALLKSTPLQSLNRSTNLDTLPSSVLTDLRYISLRKSIRDPLIEAHVSTLAAAPLESSLVDEVQGRDNEERGRRERALADRRAHVQQEKRRQQGALQFSRGMLRDGEQEVQKAMNVGKSGLLGHYDQ